MAINVFGVKKISDYQVFEYTDTLSLPIPADCNKSGIGDVVKVGDVHGVLVTEIAKSAEDTAKAVKAIEDAGGIYIPAAKPTAGLNGPGYASVRVRGGAFKQAVEGAAGDKTDVGKTVYAKAPASGKIALTLTKGSNTPVGFVCNPLSAGNAVVAFN